MAEEIKVNQIVKTFRENLGEIMGRPISQEQFGELVIEGLFNIAVVRQTVANWETGRTEPPMDFLIALYTYHFGTSAWQLGFAAECLKAMRPETFKSGIIELSFPKRNNHTNNE